MSLTSREQGVREVSLNVQVFRRCLKVLRERREADAPVKSWSTWCPLVGLWDGKGGRMVFLLRVDGHGFVGCHSQVYPTRQGVPGFQVKLFYLCIAWALGEEEEQKEE